MALKTEFTNDGHGLLVTVGNSVQGSELIAITATIYSKAKDGMPIRYKIIDLTDAERLMVNQDEIGTLAGINIDIAQVIGKLDVAIIAPSDYALDLADMWMEYINPTMWTTCVFRNERDAKGWLATTQGDQNPGSD